VRSWPGLVRRAEAEAAARDALGVGAVVRRGRALAQSIGREARAAGARTIVLGPTPDTIAFHRLLEGVLRPALRDRAFYLPVPED
jgi:hypothetical protein